MLLNRDGRNVSEHRHEFVLERGDPFLDGTGAGAHLQRRGGKEAAAGEDATLQIAEERFAHRCQLG